MSTDDFAYCAGVIDSDGCITINRQKNNCGASYCYQERVVVQQVEPQATHFLHRLFGGSLRLKARKKTNLGSKKPRPMWTWVVTGQVAAACIQAVYPWLRIKKRQADATIRLRESIDQCELTRGNRRRPSEVTAVLEEQCQSVKKLNKSKSVDTLASTL